jgi:hypothetical protein
MPDRYMLIKMVERDVEIACFGIRLTLLINGLGQD